jgi:hypothetical protein
MAGQIDTTNRFGVGVRGQNVIVMKFGSRMSHDDAMNLAAYLVAMAETISGESPDTYSGETSFDAWLNAVRGT